MEIFFHTFIVNWEDVPLLLTLGEVCTLFLNQDEFPACMLHHLCAIDSSDSPLDDYQYLPPLLVVKQNTEFADKLLEGDVA